MSPVKRLHGFVVTHQLVLAIAATIVIALIMTGVSLSLYVSSGTLQLDLSRPAYSAARKELIKPENTGEFATNGTIDKKSLDGYQQMFDGQRKELNQIGKFKDKALDDDTLQLSPDTPSAN